MTSEVDGPFLAAEERTLVSLSGGTEEDEMLELLRIHANSNSPSLSTARLNSLSRVT